MGVLGPYAKYKDVLRYAATADDPNLGLRESYISFADWISPQGITECRRLTTFVGYLRRARRAMLSPSLFLGRMKKLDILTAELKKLSASQILTMMYDPVERERYTMRTKHRARWIKCTGGCQLPLIDCRCPLLCEVSPDYDEVVPVPVPLRG